MPGLGITGLAFIGGGLAAIAFGATGPDTPLSGSLLGSGLILVASGVVMSALGLVVRQLGRLRDILGVGARQPFLTVPLIPTATLDRPSPLRPVDADASAGLTSRQAQASPR